MSYTTSESLKARGLEILRLLCIDKDFDKMPDIMTANVEAIHDDHPPLTGRDHFISHWKMLCSKLPSLSYEVYDTVAEADKGGNGGKVWAFARLAGLPGGIVKDSVDMLEIDRDGRVVKMKDVQREVAQ